MSIQYCKPCNIPHVVLIVLILSIYTCSNLHAYPSKAFIYTFTLIFLLRPLIFLPHFNPSFYISPHKEISLTCNPSRFCSC